MWSHPVKQAKLMVSPLALFLSFFSICLFPILRHTKLYSHQLITLLDLAPCIC